MKNFYLRFGLGLVLSSLSSGWAFAQVTAFTYQGRLSDHGIFATGDYDLQFSILNSDNTVVAGPLVAAPVHVTNGLWTATLDFGDAVFTGQPLSLQIGVRTNGSSQSYTLLTPSQALTAAPYAITAGRALGSPTTAQFNNLSNALNVVTVNVSNSVSTAEPRFVKLGGGLELTNAPLVFAPNSQDIPQYLMRVLPIVPNPFSGTFNLTEEGSDYFGIRDNVVTLGWNQSAGGQAQKSGAPALWLQWEQYFQQAPGQAQSEFHLDYVDLNGNSDRPLFFGLDSTNLNNWQEHHVVTSLDFRYPMQGFSNTWFTLQPGQTLWNFDGTNGLQLTYSSGYVQINPYHTFFTPPEDDLLFGAWSSVSFGDASLFGGDTELSGTLNVQGSAFFGNQSTFANDAEFDSILNLSGSANQPGSAPIITFTDNNASAAARNFGMGVMYYQGFGHGSLTLNVSAARQGTPYDSSAVPIMTWAGHQVSTYGDSKISGSVFIATNAVVPSPLGSGGWLWNSNNFLYWVTTTHTNLLSAP